MGEPARPFVCNPLYSCFQTQTERTPMIAGVNTRHTFVGGRVPTPVGVAKTSYGTLEFLVCLPIWLLVAVVYGVIIAVHLVWIVLWIVTWPVYTLWRRLR
jgi:hypothetical protein